MIASVLSAAIVQMLTGQVFEAHTIGRGKDFSVGTVFSAKTTFVTGVVTLHWRYSAPLMAAFGIGLAYFMWPTRKPPRIVS